MFEVDWPEHWKIAKLGDKAELKNGINFKKEQKGQGILTVDVLNMYSDGIYLDSTNLYRVDCKIRDRDLLRANDILFVRSSLKQEGVAWTSLFGGHEVPMTFCGFLIRARLTTSEINHEFLTHYFRTDFARRFLVSKSARLAITNISQATLSSCPIPLPPLPEQRAIAHVLQTIQEAKAARQRELALERERKAALMDHLFSHGTKGEPCKQTEIGEIPESWEVVILGQKCHVFSGYGFKTLDYTKKGIPLIKIGNLQDGEVVLNPDNDCVLESWQQQEKLQRFILQSRDILIALTGATTGKTAVVPPSLAGAFLNQRVGKIELISPDAEQDFILAVVKTKSFQKAIQQNILRSAQGNISPSSVAQIPIPLPQLPEQRAMASVFQAVDKKIAALEQEAARLDELFHAMLDELMTGKRSVVSLIDAELPN